MNKNNSALVFVLGFVMFIFIVCGDSVRSVARAALYGDYTRTISENNIDVSDWNDLLRDFVARDGSGGAMRGDLNMGTYSITNVAKPNETELSKAATVEYVSEFANNMSVANGADTYINWGRDDCPDVDSTVLYTGWTFGARYAAKGGISNILCLKNDVGGVGAGVTSFSSDIGPVSLPSVTHMDNSMVSVERKLMKCAMCRRERGHCYTVWNSSSCDASGFSVVYDGFAMGGWDDGVRQTETDTYCINKQFDSLSPERASWNSVVYGTVMKSKDNIPDPGNHYDLNKWVKCAVCCN